MHKYSQAFHKLQIVLVRIAILASRMRSYFLEHILYSWKYWRSLNLAVWAPNNVFHTIADLNLAVWYRHMDKNLADFNLAV